MRRALVEILAALRDTFVITFVEPVREGRPRPRTWPRGLPAIGAAALVLYCLLGLATIFAVNLRQDGDLVLSPSSQTSLPSSTVGLLLSGVIVSFALAHTAALRTSWWLRAALFVLGGSALFYFVSYSLITATWVAGVSAGLYLLLLVFTIVRSRKRFAWWEFVVVTALLALAMLGPWLLTDQALDTRSVAIEGTLSSLGPLTYPALLVAGSAPAQIVVTGAQAAAGRPLGRRLFWVLAAVAVIWLGVATVLSVRDGGEDLATEAFAAGALTLAGIAVAIGVWLRRARRGAPDPPDAYPEAWGPWLYPLATAIAGLLLVALPLQILSLLLRLFGLGWAADGFDAAWNFIFDNNPGVLWRAAIGVLLLVIAWRISARGRQTEAVVLGALAVSMMVDALGLVPGLAFLHERTTQAMGLTAAAVALLAGLVLAARGALDRGRARGIVAVVLLAVLYPHRNLLADPASAALVFSAQLVVLFGLTWRLFTDAGFLQKDSRLFPQPTRVLLFLANSLFAATSLAFVALARALATGADSTIWSDTGDWTLGEPLFTAGLITATWLVLRPARTPPDAVPVAVPAVLEAALPSGEHQHQGDGHDPHQDAHRGGEG